MKILKILLLIISFIALCINVFLFVRNNVRFSEIFTDKADKFDYNKFNKYDLSEERKEELKRDNVFYNILLKQAGVSLLLAVVGGIAFFVGAYKTGSSKYLSFFGISYIVSFVITAIGLLIYYIKLAKKYRAKFYAGEIYKKNGKKVHRLTVGDYGFPVLSVWLIALTLSLNLGTVIGTIPIIFGL